MNKDEIIKLIEGNGLTLHGDIEHFAALVEAAEREAWRVATPPAAQRQWVGLTDKVITKVIDSMPKGINGWMSDWDLYEYARAIEAKLKEENT